MENLEKKLESVQVTTDISDQSPTGADTDERLVDKFQSPSLLNDRRETNAFDEHRCHHHHHESLNVERLENLSASALLLRYEKLICERDSELNELKRINDIYKQELLSSNNCIKQLTVENNDLKNENIVLRAAQNDKDEIVIDEYHSRIDDSELQLNNPNENEFNENSLLKIFSYLSLDDMMQVKRVCKEWYQVSQKWFKQVQTLEFNRGRLQLYEKYYGRKIYEQTEISSFNDQISILHSCGHHINYFKFNMSDICQRNPTREFIFQWVPKLCSNVIDVRIFGIDDFYYTPSTFDFMATHWKKLETLRIWSLPQPVEENFLQLLRNNKQLKTLKLYFYNNYAYVKDNRFFSYLPTTIEKMIISNILINDTEQSQHFISASKRFTSLQSLQLSYVSLTDAVVAAIADIKSLIHLDLRYDVHFESRKTIVPIANMKGLKSLYLGGQYDIHEDNVMNIAESCGQLEQLHIRNMNVLKDNGIAAIAKLKKLKCLYIDAENVTSKSIINLCGNLEVLRCDNEKINNNDAIKLLKKATNLRLLYFCFCYNLTKDILQEANEIANRRKNNILCLVKSYPSFGDDRIDTPYFKYSSSVGDIPLEIFPKDIRYYIEKI